MEETEAAEVENFVRDAIAQGEADFAGVAPVLQHLLGATRAELFSDDILAATRGMLGSIAVQLLDALAAAVEPPSHEEFLAARHPLIVEQLRSDASLLLHVHALVLEARLAARLEETAGIDQVLTPLLQDLAASEAGEASPLAMALIAAQARFVQQHRRMELPISELPGELFHRVTQIVLNHGGDEAKAAKAARKRLRERYDEARSRLGLITRLLTGMADGIRPALDLNHAGVALFATALALGSECSRDRAIFMVNERQPARFVLAMRAAGEEEDAIVGQLVLLRPQVDLPGALLSLDPGRAARLLASDPAGKAA